MAADLVVMVVGVHYFTSYQFFSKSVDRIIKRLPKSDIILISGEGEGTNYLTFLYALRRGIRHIEYPLKEADGKSAIYRMQERMVEEATHLITVDDGKSKIVEHAIKQAKYRGISHRLIHVPRGYKREKPKSRHGCVRSLDVRTLSKYRERRAFAKVPRWTD